MFLIQELLPLPSITILLLLLQTMNQTSAFLSPILMQINGKHLVSHYNNHSVLHGLLLPSKSSSLHLFLPSKISLLPTSVIAELMDTTTEIPATAQLQLPPTVEGLSPTTTTIVFALGLVPFVWATYEFWSRIAVGASFGTGADSIQIRPGSRGTSIGEDGNPSKSRGRKVLGDDALIVAYILFAVAIGSVGIAVYSVISSPLPPM